MTIPLDNLYDYIFSLAAHYNKSLAMYRFSPHGSKNIEDIILHNTTKNKFHIISSTGNSRTSWHFKILFCHDQEPLDFLHYKNNHHAKKKIYTSSDGEPNEYSLSIGEKLITKKNITGHPHIMSSVYDKQFLLHSELNSKDLKEYEKNNFLGIYYWSHAFISLDWYRFAKHDVLLKSLPKEKFINDYNIYSRSWTNSREYRLKFLDLLKENNLDVVSNVSLSEYCEETHYLKYEPKNKRWIFSKENIEKIKNIKRKNICSSASASYSVEDYQKSAIDVILETVFDKEKIHLTEKILRPIACGKPFILVSEKNSLKYLRSYGFKTFDDLIDESYDSIGDPSERLNSVIKTMKLISSLKQNEKNNLFNKMHKIAEYNKKWFFSDEFFQIINNELEKNLKNAAEKLDSPSQQTARHLWTTYRAFRKYRKYFSDAEKKVANLIVSEFPERIELSKKNIGKY